MNDLHTTPWSWLHLLWLPLAAFMRWLMKRIDRLEEERVSPKEIVAVLERLDRMEDKQDRDWKEQNDRHEQNTGRLDQILLAVIPGARNQR